MTRYGDCRAEGARSSTVFGFLGCRSLERGAALLAHGVAPFFTLAGARSYLRGLPDAELHLLDTGHFALETHGAEIAGLIDDFLLRRLPAIHTGANRPRS